MTFDKFLALVNQYHAHHPTQRYGQSVMNVLYSLQPELYNRAIENRFDIFYTSESTEIEAMLFWLEKQWS